MARAKRDLRRGGSPVPKIVGTMDGSDEGYRDVLAPVFGGGIPPPPPSTPFERDLRIELTDAALDHLGASGFDPVYGARPLKRAIQQQLENPLAQRILKGEFRAGDTILVDLESGQLAFRSRHAAAA